MIGDSIGKGVQAKKQLSAAKKAQRAADLDRERATWMADQQDWTPEYASDHIAPYQRSQSPIADAFLNSILTGDNPMMVQGTRNQAPQMKAQAQQRFDRSYGNWDQLRQRQQEMAASTPWEVKPFTRQVSQPDVSKDAWEGYRAGGLDADEMRQLRRDGFHFNENGSFMNKSSGSGAKGAMIQGAGHTAGQADTQQGRQFMRGLARIRAEDGITLDQALALGNDEILRRGA